MRGILLGAVAFAALASPAFADNILNFGQVGVANTVTATANILGTQTAIDATAVPVTITQLLGSAAPINALLTLNATSAGNATPLGAGGFQHYDGSFSITSGPVNYLSGTFADIVLGGGASAVLSSGDPPDTISFTSNVIPAVDLDNPKAISLSFANVSPGVTIDNETFASFTSSIAGDFSSNFVPATEPASIALLGMGLLTLGLIRRPFRR